MSINHLSSDFIKAAINVYKELGPGLLESVCQSCMVIELSEKGVDVKTEVTVPIKFHGKEITDQGFRIDLLVQDTLCVSEDPVRDKMFF